ncbi:MAG: hypothetical protein RSB24_01395 [Akkermansia sp.]
MTTKFLTKQIQSYYWLILTILVALFSLNSQSFWIDEGCSAICSWQDSVNGLWQQVNEIGGSDAQIIFYYFLLWIWDSFCPDSEMGLRALNILFLGLGAFFLRKYPKALLIFLISPYVIYYMGELRPYMLQVAAGCGISVLFFKEATDYRKEKLSNIHSFFACGLFLCLTSLTSVVWFLGFLVAFMILWREWLKKSQFYKILAIWIIPYLLVALYYLYTLLFLNARATVVSSSWIFNVGSSLYETLGITGWGPSRLLVRANPSIVLETAMYWVPAFIITITAMIVGWNQWRKQTHHFSTQLALLALIGIPIVVFSYSAAFMDFRFSGRHFAPIVPIFCLLASFALPRDNWRKHFIQTGVFILFLIVWIISSLMIRFSPDYEREDYRHAVAVASSYQAQGIPVLLLANNSAMRAYHYKYSEGGEKKIPTWDQNQYVIISRPENYGLLSKQIEESGKYKKSRLCQGFTIYEKIK